MQATVRRDARPVTQDGASAADFRKFYMRGEGGIWLHAARLKTDYKTTGIIHEMRGLVKVHYEVALRGINRDKKIRNDLGATWAWVDGTGFPRTDDSSLFPRIFLNFDERSGELTERTEENPDRTVSICPGNQPLMLYIRNDIATEELGARFVLIADYKPKPPGVRVDENPPLILGMTQQDAAKAARRR